MQSEDSSVQKCTKILTISEHVLFTICLVSDDDSEPILGQWFEETLAPPETNEGKTSSSSEADPKPSHSDRANSIVPEKGEAHGYISLATQIFVFLNRHFLCTKSAYVTRYVKAGLTEQQMIILAAIVRDLDRETARTEIGEFKNNFKKVDSAVIVSILPDL